MKEQINSWSYWLGVGSALTALVMRTFNAFGVWLPGTVVQGMTIWYMSFYKAALLFFLIKIATSIDIWARILLDQRLDATHRDQMPVDSQVVGRFRTAKA